MSCANEDDAADDAVVTADAAATGLRKHVDTTNGTAGSGAAAAAAAAAPEEMLTRSRNDVGDGVLSSITAEGTATGNAAGAADADVAADTDASGARLPSRPARGRLGCWTVMRGTEASERRASTAPVSRMDEGRAPPPRGEDEAARSCGCDCL